MIYIGLDQMKYITSSLYRNDSDALQKMTAIIDKISNRNNICSDEEIRMFINLQATLLNYCFGEYVKACGLNKEIDRKTILTSSPRGKIDFTKSFNTGVIFRGKYYCVITFSTVNNLANQITKLAFNLLYVEDRLNNDVKTEVLKNIEKLNGVDDIDIRDRRLYCNYYYYTLRRRYELVLSLSNYIIDFISRR